MKKTFKFAFIALAFAAFTTSCNQAEKTAESATDSVESTVNEATTPEEGDTAVVREQEADAVIEKDSIEATGASQEAH